MSRSKKLYNSDLAPTPTNKKNWGWFEIFNVWANDVQSLFGYTLAASLFLASGLKIMMLPKYNQQELNFHTS